jgi:hypothetical protein
VSWEKSSGPSWGEESSVAWEDSGSADGESSWTNQPPSALFACLRSAWSAVGLGTRQSLIMCVELSKFFLAYSRHLKVLLNAGLSVLPVCRPSASAGPTLLNP